MAMMQSKLASAFHHNSEVIVYVKGQQTPFRGSVQDLDATHFSLFHNGCCQGLLWTFAIADVQACALVIPVPQGRQSACLEDYCDEDYLDNGGEANCID